MSVYLRTKMLDMRVAGRQKTITRISATAKLTIKKLVTVLMRGDLKTTAITKKFPTSPTAKTSRYATQYTAVIAIECLQKSSGTKADASVAFNEVFIIIVSLFAFAWTSPEVSEACGSIMSKILVRYSEAIILFVVAFSCCFFLSTVAVGVRNPAARLRASSRYSSSSFSKEAMSNIGSDASTSMGRRGGESQCLLTRRASRCVGTGALSLCYYDRRRPRSSGKCSVETPSVALQSRGRWEGRGRLRPPWKVSGRLKRESDRVCGGGCMYMCVYTVYSVYRQSIVEGAWRRGAASRKSILQPKNYCLYITKQ